VQQNSDVEWGQQRRSMWLQPCSICCCDVAAAVAAQQATASSSGRALQQLLPSAKHRHQVLAGLLQQLLPAASNHFKKSTALTSTAMLLAAFINQKQNFYDDNQSVGTGNIDRQKNGSAATVSRHVVFLQHLLPWHCRICCNAARHHLVVGLSSSRCQQ